jgi:hypothetical protein
MKYVLIALGVLVAVVIAIVVIGLLLPREHVASRSKRFARPPAVVYAAIRKQASQEAGRYEIVEDMPNEKLVTRIVPKDLGYSGSWTYVITPADGGAMLQITENGEVSNPLFRFMSRYVFGHTATMDKYLASLEKQLG